MGWNRHSVGTPHRRHGRGPRPTMGSRARNVAALLLICACAAPTVRAEEQSFNLPIGDPARSDRKVDLVLDGITDTASGALLTPVELAARLDSVRLLFVGESHTDMDFHRVQLRVIQELQKRGRQVLVGLEMYPVTEQASLDRWASEKNLTEDGFVTDSHWYKNWGYHWNYYRDIFLFARANGIRMFGVNVPREVVQVARTKGFEGLTAEQKQMLPERIDTESAEHQRLFRAFFDDKDALHGNMPDDVFQGMYRAQCTWDAAMGFNALRALKQYGGDKAIMVVLIGSGHVAYGLGAERQAKLWFTGTTASLIPAPVSGPCDGDSLTTVRASYANFLWGLPPTTDPLYPTVGITAPERKSGERYKVIMVSDDSPAAAAGFQVGDELVSVDGVKIEDREISNRIMSEKRWGDAITYRVMRGGEEITLTVFLRRHPRMQDKAEAAEPTPAASPMGMPSAPPGITPAPPAGMPSMPMPSGTPPVPKDPGK